MASPLCRHGFPLAAEHGGRLDNGRTWTCWNGQYAERAPVFFARTVRTPPRLPAQPVGDDAGHR